MLPNEDASGVVTIGDGLLVDRNDIGQPEQQPRRLLRLGTLALASTE
jgi:hypothetical protein